MKLSARFSSSTTRSFGGAAPGAPISCMDAGGRRDEEEDGGGVNVG